MCSGRSLTVDHGTTATNRPLAASGGCLECGSKGLFSAGSKDILMALLQQSKNPGVWQIVLFLQYLLLSSVDLLPVLTGLDVNPGLMDLELHNY